MGWFRGLANLFVSLSHMITDTFLTEIPFSDITGIEISRNNANNYVYNMTTNNDCLVELDADHNTLEHCTVNKCSNYDTSLEFNKTFVSQNNTSILRSSQYKLTYPTYYLEHLNIPFSFIGISETWATHVNSHILNIPIYHHEQCIRPNNKKRRRH